MRGSRSIFPILGVLALFSLPSLYADDVLTVADRLVEQHLSYIYGSDDLKTGGLDCSGFVRTVYHDSCGIDLPTEADKQLDYCRDHGQVWYSTSAWTPATLQPGDLIFFAGPYPLPRASQVQHVMIYCGHGVMAGAQGKGRRIDRIGSGVGYYSFLPHAPAGVPGESGDRFINHRHVFAYGRLNVPASTTTPAFVASRPEPSTEPAKRPPTKTVVVVTRPAKPFAVNPRID